MKNWLLLVAAFLLWQSCSSQNERGQNCSAPPRIQNGDITTLSEKQYRTGSSVQFRCQKYYAMEGQNRSFCDNGTWTEVPICLEITCNSPRVLNGSFQSVKNIYHDGDLIRIQCDSGFTLETDYGGKVVECTKNGWSPSPKCILEITCQADYIEHGTILSPKLIYKEGEIIRFSCDEGYIYVDRSGALCTKNGWSTKLQCTEMQCPPPYMRIGTFRPYRTQYMYNDVIEIWCSPMPNYGNKFSKCTANGWSPPPFC